MGTEDITPEMIDRAATNLGAQRPRPGGMRGFLIRLLEGKEVHESFVRHRAAGMVGGSMVERTTANTVYVSAPSRVEAVRQYTRYLTASEGDALAMLNNQLLSRDVDKVAGPEPVWIVTVSVNKVRPAA